MVPSVAVPPPGLAMAHKPVPGRWGTLRLEADTVNNIVQTIALIGAGIWAVYTFVYQSEIAPGLAPPTVSLTSTLEKVGRHGDMTAIRATLTRANAGQNSVRVLALTYNAIGIRENFLAGETINPAFAEIDPAATSVSAAKYYTEPARQEAILRHAILFAGAHPGGSPAELSPGESVTRDIVFYADRKKFDRIRLRVQLLFEKASEPGVPLALETDAQGLITAVPGASCRVAGGGCATLYASDYVTELSLWD